jgi:hypothetical protein
VAPRHRSGALVLAVGIALSACGCGGGGTLSASAITKESTSMQSLASEGAFLARDSAAGKTTAIYTRVHSEALAKAASTSASSLQTAKTRPALEPKLRRVASLASKVSADLKQLGHASKSEQARLARELEAAAQELK